MIAGLGLSFANLPSVQGFVRRLRENISQRRNLLVITPAGIDVESLWEPLRLELWQRNYSIREIATTEVTPTAPPSTAVATALGVNDGHDSQQRTTTALLETADTTDVICLQYWEAISDASRLHWLRFLEDWSQSAASVGQARVAGPALCAFVPASTLPTSPPQMGLNLEVVWWWGVLSVLEMQLLCRSWAEQNGPLDQWREVVLPSLAGDDVRLLERLWSHSTQRFSEILEQLSSYGTERAWTPEALRAWGAEAIAFSDGLAHHGRPPTSSSLLWAHGVVYTTREYGTELHSAALAMLERTDLVSHRIWRGQASFLLPAIDSIRLHICTRMTNIYGVDWPVRWVQPVSSDEEIDVREDPLACQLGHLERVLRQGRNALVHRRWSGVVEVAKAIRNDLAHFRPITFSRFQHFLSGLRGLEE